MELLLPLWLEEEERELFTSPLLSLLLLEELLLSMELLLPLWLEEEERELFTSPLLSLLLLEELLPDCEAITSGL